MPKNLLIFLLLSINYSLLSANLDEYEVPLPIESNSMICESRGTSCPPSPRSEEKSATVPPLSVDYTTASPPPSPRDDVERYLVVSSTIVGMGNRLRVIASAQILAEQTGRMLVVHWPINEHMPGTWNDFFQNELVTFEKSPLVELDYSMEKLIEAPPYSAVILNLGNRNTDPHIMQAVAQIEKAKHDIVYLHTTLRFKSNFITRETYRDKMVDFYKKMIPNDYIKKEVSSFINQHKFDNYFMIGAHYRGWHMGETDNNPKLTRDPSNKYLNNFIDLMKQELSRPLDKTNTMPVAFFLATDNQEAKEKLMNDASLKDCIFTRDTPIERDSIRGQEHAMVDFFLLGATNFIIGTCSSSFSDEAAMLTQQAKKIEVGYVPYKQ